MIINDNEDQEHEIIMISDSDDNLSPSNLKIMIMSNNDIVSE